MHLLVTLNLLAYFIFFFNDLFISNLGFVRRVAAVRVEEAGQDRWATATQQGSVAGHPRVSRATRCRPPRCSSHC